MTDFTKYPSLADIQAAKFTDLVEWRKRLPAAQTDVQHTIRRRLDLRAAEVAGAVMRRLDPALVEQFNRLIIREVKGYPVRLSDIGRSELGAADERNILRVNGSPAVGMGIVKQSTANTLGVARAVKG